MYQQWCNLHDAMRLIRSDDCRKNMGHHDANIDLIPRRIEDEQTGHFEEFEAFMDGGAFFLQWAMSQHWVLSSYELLRTTIRNSTCEGSSDARHYCKSKGCLRCKLNGVKKKMHIIRIPLAKFEPADIKPDISPLNVKVTHLTAEQTEMPHSFAGRGRYHGDMMFENKTGSLGWSVSKGKSGEPHIISRRSLSDDFRNTLPSNPS